MPEAARIRAWIRRRTIGFTQWPSKDGYLPSATQTLSKFSRWGAPDNRPFDLRTLSENEIAFESQRAGTSSTKSAWTS